MNSTQVLELLAAAIAAAFILSALTRGFEPRSRNAENGELMFQEEHTAARCRRHGIKLDPNGQICDACLIEMRHGIGMKPLHELGKHREFTVVRPSWERTQL